MNVHSAGKLNKDIYLLEGSADLLSFIYENAPLQKEPYYWSTFILPDGRFINILALDGEGCGEHEDFYAWLAWHNYDVSEVKMIEDLGCIKLNVTYPYASLPDSRPTSHQMRALEDWLSGVAKESDFQIKYCEDNIRSMYRPIVISIKEDKIYDLAVNTSTDIIKAIKKYYSSGLLEGATSDSPVDSQGNALSPEQVKFFKDSQVRDNKGRLQVCYHNTDAEFDIFDADKIKTGTFGNGFYFTTSKKSATSYGGKFTKQCYLNITNPAFIDEKYEDIHEYLLGEFGVDDFNVLLENGYDGVVTPMYWNDDEFEYYVAFEPNQIKLIDNPAPTSSNNLNESVEGVDSEGNKLSPEQVKFFANSKVRDGAGNLLVCYHGTPSPGFTEFNPQQSKSQFGKYKFNSHNVNYFTSDLETAQGYTELGIGDTGEKYNNIYACYINITNPYIVDNSTEADIKSFMNIKDNKIRDKQIKTFERIFNKWKRHHPDEDDIDSINRDMHLLNYEFRLSDDVSEDDRLYGKLFNLHTLGSNTAYGRDDAVMHWYTLEEYFSEDCYEEMRDAIVGNYEEDYDDYFFTMDNLVKMVLLMNEEEGTNYDGIIIEDILDVGPHGSPFTTMPGTDIVTLQSSNQIKSIKNANPTNSSNINESLHSLESDCFITDSPYTMRDILINKPKAYRVLYDANIDSYLFGDASDVIHWELIQMAYKQGYYANIEKNSYIDPLVLDYIKNDDLYNYVDLGNDGYYWDEDDEYVEFGQYLLYGIWIPTGVNEEDVANSPSSDGYDSNIKCTAGTLYMRDVSQELIDNCDLVRLLQKQRWNEGNNEENKKADGLNESVNEVDSQGNQLSPEQIAFFKNSKIRDSQGNLVVCHHCTDSEFDTFDKSFIGTAHGLDYGNGFYFSGSELDFYGSKTMQCYLNVTNPFILDLWSDEGLDAFFNLIYKSGVVFDDDVEYYMEDRWATKHLLDQICEAEFVEMFLGPESLTNLCIKKGYDGIIVGKIDWQVIVFEPNQIKSVQNTSPTNSNSINESANPAVDSEGNKLTQEQVKFFSNSKIRGRNNALLVCYHATDASFTVFDKSKIGSGSGSLFGRGFYFTPEEDLAGHYGSNFGEYYLNITNPFEYYTVDREYLVDMLDRSGYDYDKEFVDSYDYDMLWDVDLLDDFLPGALKGKNAYAEFSTMVQNAGYDGIVAGGEIIAFEPEQIKSIKNTAPTDSQDVNEGALIEGIEHMVADEESSDYDELFVVDSVRELKALMNKTRWDEYRVVDSTNYDGKYYIGYSMNHIHDHILRAAANNGWFPGENGSSIQTKFYDTDFVIICPGEDNDNGVFGTDAYCVKYIFNDYTILARDYIDNTELIKKFGKLIEVVDIDDVELEESCKKPLREGDEEELSQEDIDKLSAKYSSLTTAQIVNMLNIPNGDTIDEKSPMYILPNGSIVSVKEVGKKLGVDLDYMHSDLVKCILDVIANDLGLSYPYDGMLELEDELLEHLTESLGWARLNCGTTWVDDRFYCVLPGKMTTAQYRSLEKWLEWGYAHKNKGSDVLIYVLDDSHWYNFSENFPEDIIKKVKRYYSSGKFYESVTGILLYRGVGYNNKPSQDIDNHGGKFFADNVMDASNFGDKIEVYKLSPKAKLFRYRSSCDYVQENNLMDIENNVLYQLSGYHTLSEAEETLLLCGDNPNLYYAMMQYIVRFDLEPQGYDGVEWEYEDDLISHQYQIWNDKVATHIKDVDENGNELK